MSIYSPHLDEKKMFKLLQNFMGCLFTLIFLTNIVAVYLSGGIGVSWDWGKWWTYTGISGEWDWGKWWIIYKFHIIFIPMSCI